jgi:hypothetical protein
MIVEKLQIDKCAQLQLQTDMLVCDQMGCMEKKAAWRTGVDSVF